VATIYYAEPVSSIDPQIVELTICRYCRGKITRILGTRPWSHMASVGPNGESQHGERKCPPEGSRP